MTVQSYQVTGLKSELKLDANSIRHFGSTEENWARIKIFSSKCHGFNPWIWEKKTSIRTWLLFSLKMYCTTW